MPEVMPMILEALKAPESKITVPGFPRTVKGVKKSDLDKIVVPNEISIDSIIGGFFDKQRVKSLPDLFEVLINEDAREHGIAFDNYLPEFKSGEAVERSREGAHMSFIMYKKIVMPYSSWVNVAKKLRDGDHRLVGNLFTSYEQFQPFLTEEQKKKLTTACKELEGAANWTHLLTKMSNTSTDRHKQKRAIAINNYFMAFADNLYVKPAQPEVVQSDHQEDEARSRRDVQVDIRYDTVINSSAWPEFVSTILDHYNAQIFKKIGSTEQVQTLPRRLDVQPDVGQQDASEEFASVDSENGLKASQQDLEEEYQNWLRLHEIFNSVGTGDSVMTAEEYQEFARLHAIYRDRR
jgi:hypothetical protein